MIWYPLWITVCALFCWRWLKVPPSSTPPWLDPFSSAVDYLFRLDPRLERLDGLGPDNSAADWGEEGESIRSDRSRTLSVFLPQVSLSTAFLFSGLITDN